MRFGNANTHVYAYIHTYTYARTHTHARMHAHTHYTHARTHTHTHAYTHTHTHEHTHAHTTGVERTWNAKQTDIVAAVDVGAARKAFDLRLPDLGPYSVDFTRNGRHVLLGGRCACDARARACVRACVCGSPRVLLRFAACSRATKGTGISSWKFRRAHGAGLMGGVSCSPPPALLAFLQSYPCQQRAAGGG